MKTRKNMYHKLSPADRGMRLQGRIAKALTALFACLLLTPSIPRAQTPIYEILDQVERNNASLAARRKLTDAQTLEARTQNNLEDPEVEWAHLWGKPSDLGKSGEVTVSQGFDFPTVYAHRSKLAKLRTEQYGHEYATYRQQLLFDAQSLCIEVIALRKQHDFLNAAYNEHVRLYELLAVSAEQGNTNILDLNKVRFETVATTNQLRQNEIETAAAMERLENLNGGQPVVFDEKTFDSLDDTGLPPLDDIIARYEHSSPEMLAAMAEVAASERELKLSRSQSLPGFSVGYKHEYGTGERFNGIVVGLRIPLFSNRNNVKRARMQAEYAAAEHSSAIVDMRTSLRQLYARAEMLLATVEQFNGMVDDGTSITLIGKALDSGHISVTEYFSQLQPIYDAYITMIDTMRDYYVTRAQIGMIDL